MCGLAGAIGSLEKNERAAFENLLFMSSFRGTDSTGIAAAAYPKAGQNEPIEVNVVKQALTSPDFLDLGKVKGVIGSSPMFLMGHCRSRTVGEVNKRNAQPFEFDGLVGTHNGTLSYAAKNRLEGPGLSLPTDSEALYHRLNKESIEAVARMTDADDAMALVWFDKRTNHINLYRNTKRPLYYCFNKKGTTMFYASEAGMLYLALNRNGVEFQKIKMLPENLHLSYQVPGKAGEAFPKPTESRFCAQSFKAPPSVVGGGQRHFHFYGPTGSTASTNVVRSVGDGSAGRSDTVLTKSNIVDLARFRLNRMITPPGKEEDHYKDERGRIYDRDAFDKKMHEGCAVCGISPVWGEPVRFLNDGEHSFMCSSCVSEAKQDAEAGKVTSSTLTLLNYMS